MSKAVAKQQVTQISAQALSQVILQGDLRQLSAADKVSYYYKVCEVVGLNPLTKPFDYIVLNNKEVLYANKGCAEQLREIHKISIKIANVQTIDGVYVVVVEASTPKGRVDSSTAAVTIKGLVGDALANAYMKCETKAKRRVTLSICGLNMLDETEVNDSSDVVPPPAAHEPTPVVLPKPVQVGPNRDLIAQEIIEAKKKLKLSNEELQEWVTNKTGKTDLKTMTIPEMIALRDEFHIEIGRMK